RSGLLVFCGRLGRGSRAGAAGLGARGRGALRARTTRPAGAALATGGAVAATPLAGLGVLVGLATAADDVTLVDPHLDADTTERRLGLVGAVIDLGTQGVERHAPLVVALRAGHLGTAETTRADHLDALHLRLTHGGLDALPHRAAERHAVGALLRDALGHEWGVALGVFVLQVVEVDRLAVELFERAAQTVGLRPPPPVHDAGRAGVDSAVNRFRVREISTLEIPARSMPVDRSLRILM